MAREVVAFANFQGGRILIGVEDDGAVSGIQREDLDWTRPAEVEVVRYGDRLTVTSPGALQNAMTIHNYAAEADYLDRLLQRHGISGRNRLETACMTVDIFRRLPDGQWLFLSLGAGQRLELASIDFQCLIETLYEDVRFAEAA